MNARFLYPNFDFEYELARGESYLPSSYFPPFSQRWGAVLRLLPRFEDAEILPLEIPEREPTTWPPLMVDGELCAWGITPRIARVMQQLSAPVTLPSHDAIAWVNSKCFSQALAVELGVALPQSQIIQDPEVMEQVIQACPYPWVLKHPFGVGGRERVVGKPHRIEENARVWSLRLLKAGHALVFEPWIQKEREYSLHFTIDPEKQIHYVGSCLLLTSLSGSHRGNRFESAWEAPSQTLEDAWKAVHKIAACGYFGPVSFDAMCGHLGEIEIDRAIVEINARYTFGRLTLALARHLPQGWSYTWWHPSQRESRAITQGTFLPLSPSLPSAGVYRLPEHCDPLHASKSLVLIAPSSEELAELEARDLGGERSPVERVSSEPDR